MEAGVLNVDAGARDLSGDPGFSLISTHSPDSSPWAYYMKLGPSGIHLWA